MPLNQPSSSELIASVREMLEGDLLSAVDDISLVYQCRVSINILKIVERELAQIDALTALETAGLANILGAQSDVESMNRALVGKIHRGDFDADNSPLLDHLQQVVLAKIAIDNPRYSTYRDYLESGVIALW